MCQVANTLRRSPSAIFLLYISIQFTSMASIVVDGFSSPGQVAYQQQKRIKCRKGNMFCMYSSIKDEEQIKASIEKTDDDGETPAGIGGAEFFGGNKQKEEFYDPVAELEAGKDIGLKSKSFDRFSVGSGAFESEEISAIAQSIQQQINQILYNDNEKLKGVLKDRESTMEANLPAVTFGRSLSWETPMTTSSNDPIEELKAAKNFYGGVDLAIIGGKRRSDSVIEFSWELSLVWPTFWTPRVLLVGTSVCTMEESTITKQVDSVFGADNNVALISLLGDQIKPRFWDWYHIGMTPSAEQVPRQTVTKKGKVTVYKIPAQLVIAPTRVETGNRENRNAEMVPNHSFTCSIKTMGPKRDVYIPTTPVEVQIGKNEQQIEDDSLLLSWSIPLSTQFQAINSILSLPANDDPENEEGSFPDCNYVWKDLRQVATIPYGGNVQDPEISEIRKTLYEKVVKEGLKPKLDQDGKPKFFFWQNDVKACYIEDGLGMCVYDWRPEFANSNEVGIELVVE